MTNPWLELLAADLQQNDLHVEPVTMDRRVRAFTVAGGKIVVKTVTSKAKKGRKAVAQKKTLVLEVARRE